MVPHAPQPATTCRTGSRLDAVSRASLARKRLASDRACCSRSALLPRRTRSAERHRAWGPMGRSSSSGASSCPPFCSTMSTYSVNSLAHLAGGRRLSRRRTSSRNNLLVALLTLGEGWHNNHHHYPSSARQGFFWWEVDLTYYVLVAFARLGLVWDLRPCPITCCGGNPVRNHGAGSAPFGPGSPTRRPPLKERDGNARVETIRDHRADLPAHRLALAGRGRDWVLQPRARRSGPPTGVVARAPLGAAILVYLLIPAGMVLFVRPLLGTNVPAWHAFGWGALYGLVLYGVYDLTNLATLDRWTVRLTLADIAWGCVLNGVVSVVMRLVDRATGGLNRRPPHTICSHKSGSLTSTAPTPRLAEYRNMVQPSRSSQRICRSPPERRSAPISACTRFASRSRRRPLRAGDLRHRAQDRARDRSACGLHALEVHRHQGDLRDAQAIPRPAIVGLILRRGGPRRVCVCTRALKVIMLFANGLPLGLVFGLVLAYLEGRRQTEALSAALARVSSRRRAS